MKNSLHAAPMSFGNSQYTAPNGLRSNPLAESINPLVRSIPEQAAALRANYAKHEKRMKKALIALENGENGVNLVAREQAILDKIFAKLEMLQIQWVNPHFNRQESKRPHHLRHNDKGTVIYAKPKKVE